MSGDAVRCGVHYQLEREADRIIYESIKDETSQSAKRDILTPWKEQDRRSREIHAVDGVVDPAVRKGIYHRVANARQPYLNSCDGSVRPTRGGRIMRDDWDEHGT